MRLKGILVYIHITNYKSTSTDILISNLLKMAEIAASNVYTANIANVVVKYIIYIHGQTLIMNHD